MTTTMNKILVTGGAGYIGSHTITELINSGYDVISVDNYLNSALETYNRLKELTGKEIPYYNIDICDLQKLEVVFEENKDIVGIIHFAALKSVPDSVANPLFYYNNNNNSLTNILACCKKYGVENLIFSSSCSVYGNVKKEELPVFEDTQLYKAESPYANTKQMGEQIIENYCNSNATKVIALRYFNPVGAHESGMIGELPAKRVNNLVPLITQAAAGLRDKLTIFGNDWDTRDGSCIRDYIHVSDIADAHVKALDYLIQTNPEQNFDIINLGSGNGVSVFEAIQAFEAATDVKVPYEVGARREGDVESIYSKPEKAEKLLGWKCQYNITDMMSSAWKWQQKIIEEKIETV